MQTGSTLALTRIPREQFSEFLRTGSWRRPTDVEVKFNPNHDPATGRFTFKGGGGGSFDGGGSSGSWGGGGFTGGGGGSGGGGGASGSWGNENAKPAKPGSSGKPSIGASAPAAVQIARPAAPQWHTVERNGYTYQLDATDRTRQVTGTLTLNPDQTRSRAAQASAGGDDRLSTDDGGHYVARRFNGPTDAFNHFAQDASFNRGDYKALENQWAKDISAGDRAYVKITPEYNGGSKRPSNIDVTYLINGQFFGKTFSNTSRGKRHGR